MRKYVCKYRCGFWLRGWMVVWIIVVVAMIRPSQGYVVEVFLLVRLSVAHVLGEKGVVLKRWVVSSEFLSRCLGTGRRWMQLVFFRSRWYQRRWWGENVDGRVTFPSAVMNMLWRTVFGSWDCNGVVNCSWYGALPCDMFIPSLRRVVLDCARPVSTFYVSSDSHIVPIILFTSN